MSRLPPVAAGGEQSPAEAAGPRTEDGLVSRTAAGVGRRAVAATGALSLVVGLLAVVAGVRAEPVAAVAPDPVPVGGVLVDAPPPASFTRTGDADPAQALHLGLGLVRDTGPLRARVVASAAPGTPTWGHHPSLAEVAGTLAAPPATAAAVVDALAVEGIDAWVDASGMYVHATPTVAQAAALFGVTFGDYTGPSSVFTIPYVAADQAPTVPPALDGLLAELTGFTLALPYTTDPSLGAAPPPVPSPGLLPAPTNEGTPAGCPAALSTGAYTLDQLATAYGMEGLAPPDGRRGAGGHVAVLIDGDGLSSAALDAFQACFGLPPTEPVLHLVAPQDAPIQVSVGELNGDVQTVLGLAPHLDRLDIFQGVAGASQWPLLFSAPLEAAAAGGTTPDAITLSDADCERDMAPAVVRLLDDILLVHAAVGTTVSLPTGDNGSQTCSDLPGTSQVYPSSSPWAAAIGGTVLRLDAGNAIVQEVVWNDTIYVGYDPEATGGGPSRLFDRPAWQVGPGAFPDVRGLPDVSFFASIYPGFAQAQSVGPGEPVTWQPGAGTSFASPTFAAGIALVDARLAEQGLGPVGLVTPLLYRLAEAAAAGDPVAAGVVRDITEGTNDVTGVGCCTAGPGYDLASGLGSLRFDRLAEAAAALGPPAAPVATTTSTTAAPAPPSTAPPVTLPATGPSTEGGTAAAGGLLVVLGVALLVVADRRRRAPGPPAT